MGPIGGYRIFLAALLFWAFPAAADVFPGVSLKIPNEMAPPGGSFQLKVMVTEPKPIIIGSGSLGFGSTLVQGVVLPGNPDAAAAGVRKAGGLLLNTISPSGNLGLSTALPIIAVTLAVPPGMPLGTSVPLTIDPNASSWLGPLGIYPQQIRSGTFTAGGALSITDVIPGGGLLPAGSTVSVIGTGFQPGALGEIDGVDIASVTVVGPTRIDLVIAGPIQLDGARVSVRNPDNARAAYFSYLRAASLGQSARPLLAATEPVFPVRPLSGAWFPATAAAPATFAGLALQNPGPAQSQVTVSLQSPSGVVASASFTMPPRTELVREVSELLTGVIPQPGTQLVVTATAPVQMLGLSGNETAGSVSPVLPLLSY